MDNHAIHWFPMTAKRYVTHMFLAIAITAFVLGGFLATSHLGMKMQREGGVGHCPLMPGVVICNMTPLQHMAAAQSMFNALPQDKDFFTLLVLVLAAAVAVILPHQKKLLFQPIIRRAGFVLRREDTPLLRLLQEALSNGVIHSKAF